MKAKKAIIYDDQCPMCRWYTQAFVDAELLDKDHRISFAELSASPLSRQIELHRSKHEIPLVDIEGGETIYGVDSLLHLLQPKLPWLRYLMRIQPVNFFVRQLYNLVSYNRGIMAPSYPSFRQFDCTPDFHWGYRLFMILLLGGAGFYFSLPVINSLEWSNDILYVGLGLLVAGLPFFGRQYISYLGHVSVAFFLSGLCLAVGSWIPLLNTLAGILAILLFGWQYIRRYHILWAQMKWIKVAA